MSLLFRKDLTSRITSSTDFANLATTVSNIYRLKASAIAEPLSFSLRWCYKFHGKLLLPFAERLTCSIDQASEAQTVGLMK